MTEDLSKTVSAAKAKALMDDAPNWRQYDGMRIISNVSPATIYLAMWGQLHWIPDPGTFNGVFRDWGGIVTSDYLVDSMPMGAPLSDMSCIVISGASPAQYLLTMYRKHLISSPAVATRFNFRGPTKIPVVALDYIPAGNDVS